jgi:casein kinase I family protein HRR25
MKVCTPFPIATFPIANPALTRLYDILVDNRYRVEHKIGGGSGGDVYSGTWLLPSLPRPQIPISKGTDLELGEDVALKLEYIKKDLPVLEYESHVYESLAGGVGIPRMRWYGQECDFYVLISDLLGPSLEDLFNFCDRKFSLKTVLLLADQLIPRIEYLHSKSWVHRDIKPENFVMGTGKLGNVVHVIDFGLAQEYQQTETREHIPYCDRNHVGGTAIFASINNHLGVCMCKLKMQKIYG